MKCTFRHLSHMTPIWIGMGGDYGTINPKRMLGFDLSNLPFGGFSSYRCLPWAKKKIPRCGRGGRCRRKAVWLCFAGNQERRGVARLGSVYAHLDPLRVCVRGFCLR